jgi:mannose PTS system EIIA component
MNGILLLTHPGIAEGLIDCVKHVYGSCPEFVEWCTTQGDNSDVHHSITSHIFSMKQRYTYILILTDLYGASPSNLAATFVQKDPTIAAISGVNAPMLLRTISYRHDPFPSLCQKSIEGGIRGIISIPSTPPGE